MFLSNNTRWELFKIDKVFKLSKGKRLVKADMLEGSLNYIGAISSNNGTRQKINSKPTHLGNCITVNYNGSVGEAFYQKDSFWASDDVNILTLKGRILNMEIGLFLCTIIKANKFKFGYGRKWTLEKMKNTNILLPIDEKGDLNWLFMEEYISNIIQKLELEEKTQTLNRNKTVDTLKEKEWREFLLTDWFNFERGSRLKKEDRVLGKTPLVTAGEGNLGVKELIGNTGQKIYSNCITIDMFCNSYTHNNEFCCDDNIIVLEAKESMSKYTMLFINRIIEKDKYRYQYGRQYRQKNLKTHVVNLPIALNKQPDWEYMDGFIKSLPYSDRF